MEQPLANSAIPVLRRPAGRVRAPLSDDEVLHLLSEHERLQEEVRQLRAAVTIYAEIARRITDQAAA